MQKESESCSTPGHMMHNQAVTEESSVMSFQCSHCPLIFKSKVYLFEHLNNVHGLDVDTSLREAGLKHAGIKNVNPDTNSSSSGNVFQCQHCDFKTCNRDVLNEHEKLCPKNVKDQESVHVSKNQESIITITTTNQHKEGEGSKGISSFFSVTSASKTKGSPNPSKDLKTYKRPLQTITKYFTTSSGSNGKLPVKLSDSPKLPENTKGTLILQESPSISSGVFKVTAKSMIDIHRNVSDQLLLNDHLLIPDVRSQKPKEESKETVPNNSKRANNDSSQAPPAKKSKTCKEETNVTDIEKTSKQQLSSNEFSFEISEDDEESLRVIHGDTESQRVYFCKHCDYSDGSVRHVSNHYLNKHPYVRYTSVYIQDPHDQTATFRCLECPVEFLSLPGLKRHYTENHPKAPDVFTKQSCELNLVFKCFLCQFNTNVSKALKEHYKEQHPTHKMDNSLLYCRYSVTQLNSCEKAPSPEKSARSFPEQAHTPCKDIKDAPSPQHTTSRKSDMALYHCNNCNFSHKSVVVMHVHHQKKHPDQPVTLDKIKQSRTASQMTPEKSPDSVTIMENCTPEKNTSKCSKKAEDKAELSQQLSLSPKHTPETFKTQSKSPKPNKVESAEDRSKARKSPNKYELEVSTDMDSSPTKMFYCQLCSYSSSNVRSVIGHNNAKHSMNGPTSVEDVLCFSAMLEKKKLQSEAKASERTSPSDSKKSKRVDVHTKKELQCKEDDTGDASVKRVNVYECAENLFYCQKCNFGNPSLKGVLNHQSKIHRRINSNSEAILEHTALMREEIKKSKCHTKDLPFASHLPLPIINEGDENAFFCHFCNYRHSTMDWLLRHYFNSHRGFEVKAEYVRMHTSLVLEKTQKMHLKTAEDKDFNHANHGDIQKKKTKKLKSYSVSVPPSVSDSQTQRTLKCHRCAYTTQYLYILRRHLWKSHRSNRSCGELLRLCFKQGNVQSGYHCDMCVFSHKNAATVYKHYQEQHPERKQKFEYISTRLYVGPDSSPLKKKKPQIKSSDGISPSQSPLENETKIYSCKACSFKGSSMSGITRHYRAVHPWSVKEDGSVLGVKISKKRTTNSQLKDRNEILPTFDTYQIPLESPDSPHEAEESPKEFKCSFCPASFFTARSLNVHCGMKHQGAVSDKSNEQQEKQIQARVHVFKCSHCDYINSNYQGVLTHCQMKHPALTARADSVHVDKARFKSLDDGMKQSGPGDTVKYRGYMCKTCQLIYATVEKLNKHCEKCHKHTVLNPASNVLKPPPKPSMSKIQQANACSAQGSLLNASFLRKKIYAVVRCQHCNYSCSTKIALSRHLRVHHRNPSGSKVKDCAYKCALCSQLYFRKKHLASHYIKKHGKDAFFRYYVPLYKQVSQKSAPDRTLTPPPESLSEACKSSTTTDQNKILVYKCPACPYVNASYHGTLTHCQMLHPDLVARADELQTTEILVINMVKCTMGKGSNERGYMCRKCPQIYPSLVKLKIHSERDHGQAEPAASEDSDEIETEEQADHSSVSSLLEGDSVKIETAAANATETDLSQKLGNPDSYPSYPLSVQSKEPLYECHMCTYTGSCRKYLYCHYKYTHKLDALSIYKRLEKYNKRKRKFPKLIKAKSEESAQVKCKKCPNVTFNSCQLLIAHYSTFHRTDCKLDFTVLVQRTKRSTGSYKCSKCKKHIHGIKNLCCHLDRHRARRMKKEKAAEAQAIVLTTAQETKSNELCKQDELPLLETVDDLAKWNVTPAGTFNLPASPQTSPLKPTDAEQPKLESRDDKHSCKQCRRTFMSLAGLRSHEKSHAALAAIKKRDSLPPSAIKHNIKQYVIYKSGTLRPFRCSFCSYQTTVLGLAKSHFMKKHQDVLMGAGETINQVEKTTQRVSKEPLYSADEMNCSPEPDEEPEEAEKSLYLEPPDVQRQLNQYSLMAQIGVSSKAKVQGTMLPENSLIHCEFCNFNSGHLSSMRRHYLNRHGRKILRCKDCDFFTGIRKTLEMHMEAGHSTFQSEPTYQKDLRCPFCLYQTKNKNNMIDHIVLHREERVVPIEVQRSKLSHYLKGIVFRCHKCTFTSGNAGNLRLHMMRHNDIKPYRCRLCYFDCTQLSDLEAHLNDKHQVVRNHELVGQVSLDQLEATVCSMPEEEHESLSNLEWNNDRGDVETEELDSDCNEVLHETLADNLTEHDIRKTPTLHIMEVDQTHKQDPQEQVGDVLSPDTASGQGIKNDGNGKNLIQFQGLSCPEEKIQKESQVQPDNQLTDSEDRNIKLVTPKAEAAERSSAESGEKAAKTPHIKAFQHGASNIKALVEDYILHHIQAVDKEGCKKATQDITVKMEQCSKTEVADNVTSEKQLLDEEHNIRASKYKSLVNVEAVSGLPKVEKQLQTLMPSCAQLKISHKGNFGVSLANCKEEVHSQKNGEAVTDSYREMPVLEKAFLKEEMSPLRCCKEEEGTDHLEQMQDREDEMITGHENRCNGWEQEEGTGKKEADNMPRDVATFGSADVLCPSVAEKKLYTCEFCGRNLMNTHELTRHVMRHGI